MFKPFIHRTTKKLLVQFHEQTYTIEEITKFICSLSLANWRNENEITISNSYSAKIYLADRLDVPMMIEEYCILINSSIVLDNL
jgi:hypothetical protein